mgnify:CR=1 FL=1
MKNIKKYVTNLIFWRRNIIQSLRGYTLEQGLPSNTLNRSSKRPNNRTKQNSLNIKVRRKISRPHVINHK